MCTGEGSCLLLFDVVGAFASTVQEVDCLRCSGLLGGELDILRRFLVSAMGGGSAISSWLLESSVFRCETGSVVILGCRGVDGLLIDTCR
jgi:hypothetical protein